jgi:hypothetical protein
MELRRISSEEPVREIWKNLRLLTSVERLRSMITLRHFQNDKGAAERYRRDVGKQAEQIAYCIRQAEEYFSSALVVSLATEPLLLYYGAVCLGQALMLLKKTGDYSLDRLRTLRKHRHHGLELVGDIESAAAPSIAPSEVLSLAKCRLHLDDAGVPLGTFCVFYESLISEFVHVPLETSYTDATVIAKNFHVIDCAQKRDLATLVGQDISVADAIACIPDLADLSRTLGLDTRLRRCSLSLRLRGQMGTPGPQDGDRPCAEVWEFFVYGVSDQDWEWLKPYYAQVNPKLELVPVSPGVYQGNLRTFEKPWEVFHGKYFPDMVDAVDGTSYLILHPETYLPEPAAQMILLFTLGMISRYYPDTWMKRIDSSIDFAEAVDTIMKLISRRFPNMILNQMLETKHEFHR